jgi:hypothetical protein
MGSLPLCGRLGDAENKTRSLKMKGVTESLESVKTVACVLNSGGCPQTGSNREKGHRLPED